MIEDTILSEVYAVLTALGDGYIDTIPPQIYFNIKDNRNLDYSPQIDKDKPLDEQNISNEAISVIAKLHLDYWCSSEKEKEQMNRLLDYNEAKLNDELTKNLF